MEGVRVNGPATSMDLETIKILSSGGLSAVLMAVLIWITKTNKESIDANTKALTAFRLTFARWAGRNNVPEDDQT